MITRGQFLKGLLGVLVGGKAIDSVAKERKPSKDDLKKIMDAVTGVPIRKHYATKSHDDVTPLTEEESLLTEWASKLGEEAGRRQDRIYMETLIKHYGGE